MRKSGSDRDMFTVPGLLAAYAAAVALMSLKLDPTQWGALDAEVFHLPQINWFIEWGIQWDYPAWSASGPGFHWAMAALARATGAEALDQASWQSTLGPAVLTGMALLFFYAALRTSGASPLRALVIGFPLISSSYFWTPALHPVSECLSTAGFFAMAWALAARRPLGFGLAAAAATIARQNFLSAAGAFGLMAVVEQWPRIFTWRMVGLAALTIAPSVLLLAGLVVQWGGLTPPEWQEMHVGLSVAPVLHGLMLLGVFGWLFLRLEDVAGDPRARARELAVIVAVALVLWLLFPEDGGERPYSVVWKAAAFLPSLHGRPLLTLPLLALGMAVAFAYWRRGMRDGFRLSPELALFACYFAGQAAQPFGWQRYAEIPVLLLLCLGMARLRQKAALEDAVMLAAFAGYFALTVWRMTDFV
jgi:hypothetical protein